MSLTLSHISALDATRRVRAQGTDLRHGVSYVPLASPAPWRGQRWTKRVFSPEVWPWACPCKGDELHVLVPDARSRMRISHCRSHVQARGLPAHSVVWLDEHASMACPELLFVQMAEMLSLSALVLLGHELCGTFSRDPSDPIGGDVAMGVPRATTTQDLRDYVDLVWADGGMRGLQKARVALDFVHDGAVSAPEAVLATMYSLPVRECGYGLGELTLNERVRVAGEKGEVQRSRYPDIAFAFAPVGINYDGEGHLDLDGLAASALRMGLSQGDERAIAQSGFLEKKAKVRAKYVDDLRRNRELAASGRVVLPLTHEDLYGEGALDEFTRQLLSCARNCFGVDVSALEAPLDDTEASRDRYDLLCSMLPFGFGTPSRERF